MRIDAPVSLIAKASVSKRPSIVYASFDQFPAPKGAAVHIEAFVRALGEEIGTVDLLTVASPEAAPFSATGINHVGFPVTGPNPIARVLDFRAHIATWWRDRRCDVVHVRSIYEGFPIAQRKQRLCGALVYEVNGLPSIELKYHYPAVAEDELLLAKLRAQELFCLQAADLVVTPSAVTADHLRACGADPARIRVIPNGVDLDRFPYRAPSLGGERPLRIFYTGTLTSWQGIDHALEALRLYLRDAPATLTLVGPGRSKQREELADLCTRLGVAAHVEILEPVAPALVGALYARADVALAPLPANDRNLVQGCCPLKVLEAMAAGTPLIASDMPVVRQLAEPEREALLVRPGSAKAIKDALVRLRSAPELAASLSANARARVVAQFSWGQAQRALVDAYRSLLPASAATTRASASVSTPE